MSNRKIAAAPQSKALRVRQSPDRGHYDSETIYAVVDACLVGHIAFIDDGRAVSIPTAIARVDDALYLHGNRSSRMFKQLAAGIDVSISMCLVDGLVKARSAMHCSMNYRSVVVFGRSQLVPDAQKEELLDRVVQALIPASSDQFRPHLAKELKATAVIRIPLTEASAKIRRGGPIDDEADLSLPNWAGVLPFERHVGTPQPAPDLAANAAPPTKILASLTANET